MLWEIEIQPKGPDPERQRAIEEYNLLTHSGQGTELIARTSRGFRLEGTLARDQAERLSHDLLVDALVESSRLRPLDGTETVSELKTLTVLLKPGVMDPVAQSVLEVARELRIPVQDVRT